MKVIETSDVHGHFFPWDFTEGKPLKGTLVRANTYINKERKKYGDNLLLIDILCGNAPSTLFFKKYIEENGKVDA